MANIFPKGTNETVLKIGGAVAIIGGLVTLAVWYYFTPKYSRVGYEPVQPVHFQHDIHVGQLGLDCRYCHSYVEVSGHSNVPATQTCMNCHRDVQKNNPKLQPVRDSWATGEPISWVKVHNVPDYAYFNRLGACESRRELCELSRAGQPMNVVFQDKSPEHGVSAFPAIAIPRMRCAPSRPTSRAICRLSLILIGNAGWHDSG